MSGEQAGAQQRGRQGGKSGKQAFDSKWLERNQLQRGKNRGLANEAPQQYQVPQAPMEAPIIAAPENRKVDDSISFYNTINGVQPGDVAKEKSRPAQNPFGSDGSQQMGQMMQGMGGQRSFGNGSDDAFGDSVPFGDAEETESRERLLATGPGSDISGAVLGSSLSSLDIDLPERGVSFYFKSPRGKASVVAMPLETRSFSRWMSVAITLGVCVGVGITCWFLAWLCQKPVLRGFATIGLFLGGLISLTSAFFPVYGLIALAASMVLIFEWLAHSIWQAPAATAR